MVVTLNFSHQIKPFQNKVKGDPGNSLFNQYNSNSKPPLDQNTKQKVDGHFEGNFKSFKFQNAMF